MRFIQTNVFLYFFLLILGVGGFFFAVIWPEAIGFYSFIIFAAIGGFGVAFYIHRTKRHHAQLVCPIGSDCNAVITSRYSKFLGVPLEYWGMFYYGIIVIFYTVLVLDQRLFPEFFLSGLILLTSAAFFFSLYFLFVQAFLLRQWCIWCLLSAMLSIVIFIVSLASVDFALAVLAEATIIIGAVHSLGFVLGMGGATTALFLFFRFLRDLDIDESELQAIKGISELVWFGLALILVSQFASYIVSAEILARSGSFLIQTIALFVVAVSGAVLMIIFAPFLAVIPFNAFNATATESRHLSPLESLRRPLFITGAVALSSWYFAFITNYLPEYGLPILFSAYISVLAASVITALLCERKISKTAL